MNRPLELQDFAVPHAVLSEKRHQPDPETGDDGHLDAYETGYKSGWDDCMSAEREMHRRIGSDLAASLAEVTLTYDAARREVLSALGPLLDEIARTLLPRMAADAVAPAVIEDLREAAETAVAGTVTVVAAPETLPTIQRLAEDLLDLEIRVEAEPAFAPAQVSIRAGTERREIDLGSAANRISEALRDFIALNADSVPEVPQRRSVAND